MIYFILLFFLFSCDLFDSIDELDSEIVYVAKQGEDQIAVLHLSNYNFENIDIDLEQSNCSMNMNQEDCIDAGCHYHYHDEMSHYMCMRPEMNGPHFILTDKINSYLFVTNIESGWVLRYDLNTHSLIDKIMVGNMPALMVLNENNKKLYISRMMSMSNMNQIETSIQAIDYKDPSQMIFDNKFEIGSPSPHAIAINNSGTELYVATYEGDWLFKININTNEIISKPLEEGYSLDKSDAIKRLKPVQCISVNDSLLFISCEGGIWENGDSDEVVPGQIQMWNTNTMTLIDTLEFSALNRPWHLVSSPIKNEIYVVLKGQFNAGLYPNSDGISSIGFNLDSLDQKWVVHDSQFKYLHGIDISDDGKRIFISGETDSNVYEVDVVHGHIITVTSLGEEGISKLQGLNYLRK